MQSVGENFTYKSFDSKLTELQNVSFIDLSLY